MKFIDIFAGMGTARMAFEKAEHECVYSIEWDKHKRKIYGVVFENEPEGSDIRTVRATQLPQSDCWIAGFPCQDISVAGKQKGFKGHRSSLFFEVTRIIREMPEEDRPGYLLFENVKNFFSVNGGYDFLSALIEMDEIGYDAEWQLLNTKEFGVPQNRERVFIVGHLRGRSTRKVFPITGQSNSYDTIGKSTETAVDRTLQVAGHSGGNHSGMTILQIGNCMPRAGRYNPNEGRVFDPNGISPCLTKMEGGGKQPFVLLEPQACLTPDRPEKKQNGRRFKEPGEPMFTLTKQDIHGVMLTEMVGDNPFVQKKYEEFIEKNGYMPEMFNPYNCSEITDAAPTLTAQGASVTKSATVLKHQRSRIRRLTPKECMRLQAVPDYITDKLIDAGISDTQLYKATGDAWTVEVGYQIAKRMEIGERRIT